MKLFFDFINCYFSTLLPTKMWNSFEINCSHLASLKLSDTHFIISVTVYEVLDNVLEVRRFLGTVIALVCTHLGLNNILLKFSSTYEPVHAKRYKLVKIFKICFFRRKRKETTIKSSIMCFYCQLLHETNK